MPLLFAPTVHDSVTSLEGFKTTAPVSLPLLLVKLLCHDTLSSSGRWLPSHALATVNIEPALLTYHSVLKHTNKYYELLSTSGMMDNITCKYDPDCIMDDIIANSERDVLIFQPPLDISLTGELNLHNQNGLLEYQYRKLQHARNIRLLGYSGRSDSNDARFHLSENSLKAVDGELIAISCCWGGEIKTKSLPISSSAYLKVTKTVDSLLRYVAGVASGLPVWVDAICLYVGRYRRKYHRNLKLGPLPF